MNFSNQKEERKLLFDSPAIQIVHNGAASKSRHLFLFSDSLIVAKLLSKKDSKDPTYHIKVVINLWRVSVGPHTEKNTMYSNLDHHMVPNIVAKFNDNPFKTLGWLISSSVVQSTSKSIAYFLHLAPGIRTRNVAMVLNAPENQTILKAYIELYDFSRFLRIDDALRAVVQKIILPTDLDGLDRLVECFCVVWINDTKGCEANSSNNNGNIDELAHFIGLGERIQSPAILKHLVYLILALNQRLYSPPILIPEKYTEILKGSVSLTKFVSACEKILGQSTPSVAILESLYTSIRDFPLKLAGVVASTNADIVDDMETDDEDLDEDAFVKIEFFSVEAERENRDKSRTGGIPSRLMQNANPIDVTVSAYLMVAEDIVNDTIGKTPKIFKLPNFRIILAGRDTECTPSTLHFYTSRTQSSPFDSDIPTEIIMKRKFKFATPRSGPKAVIPIVLPPIRKIQLTSNKNILEAPIPSSPRGRPVSVDPHFKKNLFRIDVEGQGMSQTKKFTWGVSDPALRDEWWHKIEIAAKKCWREKQEENEQNKARIALEKMELESKRWSEKNMQQQIPETTGQDDSDDNAESDNDDGMFSAIDSPGSVTDISKMDVRRPLWEFIRNEKKGPTDDDELVYETVEDTEYFRRTPQEDVLKLPWQPGEVMKLSTLMKRSLKK
ncbi:GDP/GTP exchange factor for ARF [Nowakowskiella sp. JEL0407]|nr:GDP/GTP exchange factor for ARF [Nowakowskiella sp. JEL0407]